MDSNKEDINRDKVETLTFKDVAYSAGQFALSTFLPMVGTIFFTLYSSPAENRRNNWIESLENKIKTIESQIPDIQERIKNCESAISATFYASPIALKTTDTVKHNALQNVIINSAINPNWEEYQIQMILNILENLTKWHIMLLTFFDNPSKCIKQNSNVTTPIFHSILSCIKFVYPELNNKQNTLFLPGIVNSLFNNGLISIDEKSLNITMTENGVVSSRTTELGKILLQLIAEPIVNKPK